MRGVDKLTDNAITVTIVHMDNLNEILADFIVYQIPQKGEQIRFNTKRYTVVDVLHRFIKSADYHTIHTVELRVSASI